MNHSVRKQSSGPGESKPYESTIDRGPEPGRSNSEIQELLTDQANNDSGLPKIRVGVTAEFFDLISQENPRPAMMPDHQGSERNYWGHYEGPVFAQQVGDDRAISPFDIEQGRIGDCYLITALMAIAERRPEVLQQAIKENDDGTYTVTLHREVADFFVEMEPFTVTIDATFPSTGVSEPSPMYASGGRVDANNHELWPMLFEKALAVGAGKYEAIGKGGRSADIFEAMLGKPAMKLRCKDLSEEQLYGLISSAWTEKRPFTVGFRKAESPDDQARFEEYGLVDWHVYHVEDVDLEARTLTLKNPWGHRHPSKPVPISFLPTHGYGIDIAG